MARPQPVGGRDHRHRDRSHHITLAVQIPILGWIFFNEQLGLAEVAGIALVVAGVLAMRARRQPNSPG